MSTSKGTKYKKDMMRAKGREWKPGGCVVKGFKE
jgi:hypothetical protein